MTSKNLLFGPVFLWGQQDKLVYYKILVIFSCNGNLIKRFSLIKACQNFESGLDSAYLRSLNQFLSYIQ